MTDTSKISPETLSAFFDGELSADEAARVQGLLGSDAQLQAELADWKLLKTMTVASLEAEAAAVPEARFEQIWDQIDATLRREAQGRAPEAATGSWVSRAWEAVFPHRYALAALGAAAAVAVFVLPMGGAVNQAPEVASVAPPAAADSPSKQAPMPSQATPKAPTETAPAVTELAVAPGATNDAEIEMIEFGGKAGRIGQIEGGRGTTTVIWVTDEAPVDSERSL